MSRKAHTFNKKRAQRVPKTGYRVDGSAVYRKGSEYLIVPEKIRRNRSGGDQKNVQYEITRNQYENQSRLDLYRIIVSSQKCYTGLQIVF